MSDYKSVTVHVHNAFGQGRFDGPTFEFQETRSGGMRIRRASDGAIVTVSAGTWTAVGGKWTGVTRKGDTGRGDTIDG